MFISHQYKSPNYGDREGTPIQMILLHATVGSLRSAREHLCSPATGVSSHYLIGKDGSIFQLVPDELRAHHAGRSAWRGTADVNDFSIGIELENSNSGSDPYPTIQVAALRWLCRQLLTAYGLTPDDIDTHAAVALPKNRKSDPAGFPLAMFRASLSAPPASPTYSEDSPILGTTTTTVSQVYAALAHRFPETVPDGSPNYTRANVRDLIDAYWRICLPVGINPLLAVSQMLHETGYLTSFWSLYPQNNPAGIGVNGQWSMTKPPILDNWAYNTQRQRWEMGMSFKDWPNHAIPAHVGRLLAYALPAGQGTERQRVLIARALSYRSLPSRVRGSAQTIKQLGKVHNPSGLGWSNPGPEYGTRIATIANTLVGDL